ncbi:MAG: hypothetical protein R3322_22950 [Kiloniellales bacterium]|jgi:hypothetical protein|nr:hypothetical protein [Kiloniellales bacterium]
MHTQRVRAGQQYYSVDGAAHVWQVQEVFGEPGGLRHVRLFNVEAPRDVRTLTCAVLGDSRRFRLLSEDPDHGAARSRSRGQLRGHLQGPSAHGGRG